MEIQLQNTLSGRKEPFKPINNGKVSMYHCGPTVYNFAHIGNMRSYVLADTLRRIFEYYGFKVKQVINITDVGHLVGDGDVGEDKIELTAKKEGKTAGEIARFYEEIFHKDLEDLNIKTNNTKFPRASEHIKEQLELIKILWDKKFAYEISDGIYFDTEQFPQYFDFSKQKKVEWNLDGARIPASPEKRTIFDFALWRFSKPKDERQQEWDPSEFGYQFKKGFPGWHIECSAMSRKYLGQPFDIHTGGTDHIPVHHTNEIAQSEAAFETPLANFWLHNEFITVEGEKMAKSLANTFTLADLKERKIHPLSFRYWLLTGRYNTPTNFTWEAVEGAQVALEKIITNYTTLTQKPMGTFDTKPFEDAISDNLNTPVVVALLQEAQSRDEIDMMDKILGLNIKKLTRQIQQIPDEILDLQKKRVEARKAENWKLSDDLRDRIGSRGFIVKDPSSGRAGIPSKTLILRSLSSLV